MRNSRCFVLLTVIFCGVSLHAQTAVSGEQGQVPLFKANAHAVVVDVVVTKGSDEPVLALHKQDFAVIEDGKPQSVDYF